MRAVCSCGTLHLTGFSGLSRRVASASTHRSRSSRKKTTRRQTTKRVKPKYLPISLGGTEPGPIQRRRCRSGKLQFNVRSCARRVQARPNSPALDWIFRSRLGELALFQASTHRSRSSRKKTTRRRTTTTARLVSKVPISFVDDKRLVARVTPSPRPSAYSTPHLPLYPPPPSPHPPRPPPPPPPRPRSPTAASPPETPRASTPRRF